MQEGGYCATPTAMRGIELFTDLRDSEVFVDNVAGPDRPTTCTRSFYSRQGRDHVRPVRGRTRSRRRPAPASRACTTLGGFPAPKRRATFTKPTAYQGFTGVGFMITKQGASPEKIDLVKQLVTRFYADADRRRLRQGLQHPAAHHR